jgi:carbonic anhydrase/acetyltransferase-like protein (isoleucine patch superfamily)
VNGDIRIHPSAFVSDSARLYGRIEIGEGSSVWHNAVMRSECCEIRIGRMTNVQDFVMVHVGYDDPTRIGDFCSIAHHATVHGCTIEDHCLVGINAVVMEGARIGCGSIVAGGAVVTEGASFAPGSIIAGVPAKVIASRDSARANRLNAWLYHRNAEFVKAGRYRAWEGGDYEAWLARKRAEIEADLDLARAGGAPTSTAP